MVANCCKALSWVVFDDNGHRLDAVARLVVVLVAGTETRKMTASCHYIFTGLFWGTFPTAGGFLIGGSRLGFAPCYKEDLVKVLV